MITLISPGVGAKQHSTESQEEPRSYCLRWESRPPGSSPFSLPNFRFWIYSVDLLCVSQFLFSVNCSYLKNFFGNV